MFLVKVLVVLSVPQVVWVGCRLLLDTAKRLTQLANDHVVHESRRNVVGSKKVVELGDLGLGHAEAANAAHGQLPSAEAALAVVVNGGVVLVAHGERGLHGSLIDPVPVHDQFSHEFFLEAV